MSCMDTASFAAAVPLPRALYFSSRSPFATMQLHNRDIFNAMDMEE